MIPIASIEYNANDWHFAAEYARQTARLAVTPPILPTQKIVGENAYVMASRRLTTWFEPGMYYSLSNPNVDDSENAKSADATNSRIRTRSPAFRRSRLDMGEKRKGVFDRLTRSAAVEALRRSSAMRSMR